jgi:hypothetical protein
MHRADIRHVFVTLHALVETRHIEPCHLRDVLERELVKAPRFLPCWFAKSVAWYGQNLP